MHVVIKEFEAFEAAEDLFDWYMLLEGASHGYELWAEERYSEYTEAMEAQAAAMGLPVVIEE